MIEVSSKLQMNVKAPVAWQIAPAVSDPSAIANSQNAMVLCAVRTNPSGSVAATMTVSVHALAEDAPRDLNALMQWLDLDPQAAHRGLFEDPAFAVTRVAPARLIEATVHPMVCSVASATIRTCDGLTPITAHAFFRFAFDGRCLVSVSGQTIDVLAVEAHERSLTQVVDNISIGFER